MIVFRFSYRRTIRFGISSLNKYLYLYIRTKHFVVALGLSSLEARLGVPIVFYYLIVTSEAPGVISHKNHGS